MRHFAHIVVSLNRSPRAVTLVAVLTIFIVGVQSISNADMARADYTIALCGFPPFANGASGYEPYPGVAEQCTGNSPSMTLDGNWVSTTEGYLGELTAGHLYAIGITAPGHITISGVKAALTAEAWRSGSLPELLVGDTSGVFFSHMISPGEGLSYAVNQALPAGETSITFGERCRLVVNASCYFQSQYGVLTIQGLTLVLHDDETPSLTLTGGTLLEPGTQTGTEDVSFSASAQESGVAEVDAYLGSTLVGSDAYQSTQCSYTRFYPCPKTVSDTISVDTTKVPDGSYLLVLKAYDASGNVIGVPWSVPITIANDASPAGSSQGAGSQADSSAPGAPNGRAATTKAEISYLSGKHGKLTVAEGQAPNVTGRLTSQTGTPIPDATVDLLYQTVGSNEPFVVGGHSTTNANGVYTFTVPPGPSRVIRTGYRAFANDNGYDATADLTEDVTAATSLIVKPNHLRGRTFTFSGQIHAGNFPPGQQVEIQALVGSTWTHVTYAQVTPNGHFKVRYRLKHHYNHVTFIFRATPVTSPIWPYEGQPSNLARLHLL
jgi:hypothetical protein